MLKRLALMAMLSVLAGCFGGPVTREGKTDHPAGEVVRPSERSGLSAEAQRALAKRGIKPHEIGPINVKSQCSHVDETGTVTRLALLVDEGNVKNFEADVLIKGRGRCRFSLADFRQETRSPNALLRQSKHPDCTVRMWQEQNEKITVAFSSCPRACEGNAFEYLWPILVETRTGQCF
jgi:hypothetical protein